MEILLLSFTVLVISAILSSFFDEDTKTYDLFMGIGVTSFVIFIISLIILSIVQIIQTVQIETSPSKHITLYKNNDSYKEITVDDKYARITKESDDINGPYFKVEKSHTCTIYIKMPITEHSGK